MRKHRATELDIARGIAVIGMVLVHVYLNLCGSDNSLFYGICYVLGTPMAAPVFMVLLGVNLSHSAKTEPKQLAIRGLKLLLLGALFNVAAYALPNVAAYLMFGEADQLYWAKIGLSVIDILQFAGAAYLVFALCQSFRIKTVALLGITVLLQLIQQFLLSSPVSADSFGSWALGYLIGGPDTSCFPIVCWMLFPVAGRLYGEKRRKTENLQRFYRNTVFASGLVLLVSLGIHTIWGSQLGTDTLFADAMVFAKMPLLGNVIFGAFVFLWIGICALAEPYVGTTIRKTLVFLSRHTTWVYFLHVPVIKVFRVLVFRNNPVLGAWETTLFTVLLLLFCSLTAWAKDYIIRKTKNNGNQSKENVLRKNK